MGEAIRLRTNKLEIETRKLLVEIYSLLGFDIDVIRAYQNTQQGRSKKVDSVYYHLLNPKYETNPFQENTYNATNGNFDTSLNRQACYTMRIMARVVQDPANLTQYTSYDLLDYLQTMLASTGYVTKFKSVGIGVRTPKSIQFLNQVDEHGQHESRPFFDVELGIISGYDIITDKVDSVKGEIDPI
jgi:hypothetical protein